MKHIQRMINLAVSLEAYQVFSRLNDEVLLKKFNDNIM